MRNITEKDLFPFKDLPDSIIYNVALDIHREHVIEVDVPVSTHDYSLFSQLLSTCILYAKTLESDPEIKEIIVRTFESY